jgi:hypothetical protein
MRGVSSLVLSLLLLLGAFASACAPSSVEVMKARQAEYDPREYVAIFEACKAAMIESGYHLAGEDLQHGVLISQWRWYTREGQPSPFVDTGSALFRVGVELGKGPHGGLVVHVEGGAQGISSTGAPVARVFKHDDPEEPTWVEGKIDNLAVGIHTKVAQYQLKEGTPGVTPAAPAAAPAAPTATPAEPAAAPATTAP